MSRSMGVEYTNDAAPRVDRDERSSRIAGSRLIVLAAAIGLASGFVEIGLLGIAKYWFGRYTHLSLQVVWLAPLFYGALCTAVAAAGVLARQWWRSLPLLTVVVVACTFVGASGVLLLLSRLHIIAVLVLAAGIAAQARYLSLRFPSIVLALGRRIAPGLALGVLVAFLGVNGPAFVRERLGSLPPANPGAPNVLLIIWDTARAASLSVYGYPRRTTPTLERLASEGVAFDHAFSTAPWTLPAHASMFTGRLPDEIAADWERPLEAGPATIAEVLHEAGYRTGGFVANRFYVGPESGLARGFLHYDTDPIFSLPSFAGSTTWGRMMLAKKVGWRTFGVVQTPGRKYGAQVSDEFLSWLDRGESERPFFAFLNYFDAHHPYLPPPPFDTLFGSLLPGRDPSMAEDRAFTPRELQAEIDGYDGGIAYDDNELARLLAALESRGRLTNTIVIVTSDHGEEFGEHGVFTHGNTMYDPALRVPLIIWGGGDLPAGRRVADWVSTRDVAATIAQLAGAPAPDLGGSSLTRFWSGPRLAPGGPDTLLAEVSYARGHPERYPVSAGDMVAVLAAPYKYIRDGRGAEEVYDLAADPGETVNLVSRPFVAAMLPRFRALAGATGGPPAP